MRTTLTLDKDVAARLEQTARRRRLPFKTIVNDALRAGLSVIDKPAVSAAFRTSGFDLGASLVGSLDDVHGVLGLAESARGTLELAIRPNRSSRDQKEDFS